MRCSIIKKIIISILIFSMCVFPVIPVDAAETSTGEIIVTEEYAKSQRNKFRYGEREEITVIATNYGTTTVTPNGQPEGGYKFSTDGGVYVNTSGGPTISVSFSVSWGGVVSTGVSIGLASKSSNVGGLYLTAPNNTDYFKAKIDKKYKIEWHKVDVYQYNEYKYTYYSTPATLYSVDAYLVKV